jgi:hypothetical protein
LYHHHALEERNRRGREKKVEHRMFREERKRKERKRK